MLLESLKSLYDVERAGRLLRDFAAGRSLEQYRSDAMLRSAVERQFIIIGEAMRRLLGTDPDVATAMTNYRQIIDFRNVLVHGTTRSSTTESGTSSRLTCRS